MRTPAAAFRAETTAIIVVVDSDDDDDDDGSVWQPTSPIVPPSRQYAKPTSKPSAQVASTFLAKRRGVPEEINLDSDDDELPTLASMFSASQRDTPTKQQPSQSRASSSTQPERRRQIGRSAAETTSNKGEQTENIIWVHGQIYSLQGKNKTPYRRPRTFPSI